MLRIQPPTCATLCRRGSQITGNKRAASGQLPISGEWEDAPNNPLPSFNLSCSPHTEEAFFALRYLQTDVVQKSSRAGQQKNVSAKPVNTLLPPQLRGR